MSEFYKYFRENMEALGLPAPESLFGTLEAAAGRAAALIAIVEKMGPNVTIAEVVGAGTNLEKLAVIGSASAAFYVGAVVGSIAVATGRTLSGGTSISDVLFTAFQYQLSPPWLKQILMANQVIYDSKAICRSHYRYKRGAA